MVNYINAHTTQESQDTHLEGPGQRGPTAPPTRYRGTTEARVSKRHGDAARECQLGRRRLRIRIVLEGAPERELDRLLIPDVLDVTAPRAREAAVDAALEDLTCGAGDRPYLRRFLVHVGELDLLAGRLPWTQAERALGVQPQEARRDVVQQNEPAPRAQAVAQQL